MAVEISAEQQLRTESQHLMVRANSIRVSDQKTYDAACQCLQEEIIPFRKRWAEYWDPLRDSAYKTYKGVLEKFQQGDNAAEQAEKFVKNEIRRWDEEQAKIEAERQREAQLEAERVAEEERQRSAIYAETSGASEAEVQAIVAAPLAVVAPPVEPAYQRAAGISKRENWKAKVTDLWMLVKAAAKDKRLLAYLQADETALNQRARADKGTMNIPGVIAYSEGVVSVRGK